MGKKRWERSTQALGLTLAALAAGGCGSPGKRAVVEAAALEAQGKLEEAAAKLETVCALSPGEDPCPGSDARASETWQKAAEKAVSEGRYRDAERLLHRAMITADEAGKGKIGERLSKPDMAQGLRYERALMLPDKGAVFAVLQDVATADAPIAAKAKEWIEKERTGLLVAAVLAACGPAHEGSCTKAWASLQATGAKGPDVDKAQQAAEAENGRVLPLRAQAEGFLPVFVGRFKKKTEYDKCMASLTPDETTTPQIDCFNRVWENTTMEDKYDGEKNQDTLFRRTLKQIADPAIIDSYKERARLAETSGSYTRQDIPKPPPAAKKP